MKSEVCADTRRQAETIYVTDREQKIISNQGLVWHVVKRFTGRGLEREELFQIGCIGLIKAVDRFDESFQVQFSTYAVPMIIGELKRYFREDGLVKVSRGIKENRMHIQVAAAAFRAEFDREPTVEELGEQMNMPVSDIVLAIDSAREVEAIGEWEHVVEPETEQIINKLFVEEMLAELGETERTIIRRRYFKQEKQKEIASQLGMSQVQVSRLEKRALNQLYKKLQAEQI